MTIDLNAIRARADAATEGPWRLETDHCDCSDGICSHGAFPYAIRLPVHTVGNADRPCVPGDSLDGYNHLATDMPDLTMETAEFIVHARTDVPALLAEIGRLCAALEARDANEERASLQTIDERDKAQDMADRLAEAIGQITGVDMGEHSNMNDPWQNALQAATDYADTGGVPVGLTRRR